MQDVVSMWQAVLGEIELSVSQANFVTWFKNTKVVRLDENSIVIGVPNIFVKNQLERKFSDLISTLLEKNGVSSRDIVFKISSDLVSKRVDDEPVVLGEKTAATASQRITASPLRHSYRQGLNHKYTFESFIVGSGNELAYAAAQAVASSPGTKYNPLFLYGGVGIGKTHLIQAIGNEVANSNPKAHIVYISTEQFVQEFLDAVRFKKNTDFAGYYRSADVLIVDDIQFISGKEKTQDEFFHTFNALHQANKQIILSSDRPPGEIPTLEDRLKSRFAWGMSIDMQNPDFETRCAILQTKANALNIELEPSLVDFLANLVRTNIRELEGALNQVLAFCEMRGVKPDLAVAQSIFSGSRARPKHLSAKQIIEKTARYFQIELGGILGPKRDKEIVVPRQIAMYLLRSELHLSFPKIAQELGRKDHTTAIHSVEKIERELSFDPQIKQFIEEIKEQIYV